MKALLTGLCLVVASASWAETVTIGAEDDWAPYCSKVGNEAQGFAVDIVRESFKAAGVDVKFSVVPYARCMAETKDGALAGCFDAARNNALEKDYLWHAKPLFYGPVNIYALTDSKESGLKTKDLEGKKVGVTNNYEYGDEFDSNKKVLRDVANKDEQGFNKLLNKQIPYMVAYEKPANSIFKANKNFQGKFKVIGQTANPALYIAFSKKNPDGAKFLPLFNKGFEAIQKNGKYKEIETKWK
jgi:polar amino acid transport system substrate-binding protein